MYKSPISINFDSVLNDIRDGVDNSILKAVTTYNVDITKEELEKALAYDREQYEVGYKDGKQEGYSDGYTKGYNIGYYDGIYNGFEQAINLLKGRLHEILEERNLL